MSLFRKIRALIRLAREQWPGKISFEYQVCFGCIAIRMDGLLRGSGDRIAYAMSMSIHELEQAKDFEIFEDRIACAAYEIQEFSKQNRRVR